MLSVVNRIDSAWFFNFWNRFISYQVIGIFGDSPINSWAEAKNTSVLMSQWMSLSDLLTHCIRAPYNNNNSINNNHLTDVCIKRGIFQGDSLSPLLFITALIPLPVILWEAVQSYRFQLRMNTIYLVHVVLYVYMLSSTVYGWN